MQLIDPIDLVRIHGGGCAITNDSDRTLRLGDAGKPIAPGKNGEVGVGPFVGRYAGEPWGTFKYCSGQNLRATPVEGPLEGVVPDFK